MTLNIAKTKALQSGFISFAAEWRQAFKKGLKLQPNWLGLYII